MLRFLSTLLQRAQCAVLIVQYLHGSDFQVELDCLVLIYRQAAQKLSPTQQSILVGTFIFCSLALSLVDGDMYYTCRFYHAPIQNFWAVILGLVSFQLPLSWWLIRGKSGQVASLWTVSTPQGSAVELQ